MTHDLPTPVVATHGSTEPAAPLVVLLHGRGADETSILELEIVLGIVTASHAYAAGSLEPATA